MSRIASALPLMPSIGFRGSKKSEATRERNSAITRLPAGPTHISTASTAPRLPVGGGRTSKDVVRLRVFPVLGAVVECGHIPLLVRRGGCAVIKMSRSILVPRRRGGQRG